MLKKQNTIDLIISIHNKKTIKENMKSINVQKPNKYTNYKTIINSGLKKSKSLKTNKITNTK